MRENTFLAWWAGCACLVENTQNNEAYTGVP